MKRKILLQLVLPLLGLIALFSMLAFAPNSAQRHPALLEMSVILREADSSILSTTRQGMEQAAADLNELIIKNDYHLNTGFLSTPSLPVVLAQYGYLDTAYRLLLQDTCPSWLYAVKKGATTIWETWDGIDAEGKVHASLNHYSYGAVCGWLFSGVCGIRLENGRVTIAPEPYPALQYAKAAYDSPVGTIVSGWKYEGDQVTYEFTIP